MEKYLQHLKDCHFNPDQSVTEVGLQGYENICTCGLNDFKTLLRESRSIPSDMKPIEGELSETDMYCRIRTSTAEDREKSRKLILWIGSQAADRLLDEPVFEVRKFKSGNIEQTHCAVVMCTRRVLWTIPRNILERVQVKR